MPVINDTANLIKGLVSYVPGVVDRLSRGTGGTISARYCYSVWLRHLITTHYYTGNKLPESLAEIGPGDSIGTGLAAMLSGVQHYYAFDVFAHNDQSRLLDIFDELVSLYQNQAPLPGTDEFPEIIPHLDALDFPNKILTPEIMARALAPARLEAIRDLLRNQLGSKNGLTIRYQVPWETSSEIMHNSVDMILSQSVLEHVADLEQTYQALAAWLKLGGVISNAIDYRSHGYHPAWNGHWRYGDRLWQTMMGRRPSFLNREPHSSHCYLAEAVGLQSLLCKTYKQSEPLPRHKLAKRFQELSEEDYRTSASYMVLTKG